MSQFANARRTMVDNQLRTTDVTDLRVLGAFGSVPREAFLPASAAELAYIDQAQRLATAEGRPVRWLLSPSPLAKLVQLAEITSSDKVLVIGSGSGYSLAVIAQLAASVVGLEEDADLVAASQKALQALGPSNVTVVQGRLTVGCASKAPFDVILIEGGIERLPAGLSDQLADGGRLITVEGNGLSASARVSVRSGGVVSGRNAFNVSARILPGFERVAEFVF